MSDIKTEAAKHLFEYAFEQQLFLYFVLDVEKLDGSGVPAHILKEHRPYLPIELDPMYHEHNEPTTDDEGVDLLLGFDSLYNCRIPWNAVVRIGFILPPDGVGDMVEMEQRAKGPQLKLVE